MYNLLFAPFLIFSLFGPLEGCTPVADPHDPVNSDITDVTLVSAFPELSFRRPVALQAAPGQPDYVYVMEQAGQLSSFENRKDVSSKTRVLNIDDRVDDSSNEMGLLGLAFHPDFASNGYLFVNYTASDPRRTVIARFTAIPSDPTSQIDKATEKVILEIDQPYGNHNGGGLEFGPDGYLYIGVGDGGAGGDPQGNGQNLGTLLATILRIDVDGSTGNLNYAVPDDNPFVGRTDARGEIWAYGLRNPWRFSFDSVTGNLWVADVGQNQYEEVDIVESGKNYGWKTMEASHCFSPKSDCDQTGLVLPVAEYGRGLGGSITGGYVYRGTAVPALAGLYVYADYVSGRIWALTSGADTTYTTEEIFDTDLAIVSFGIDSNNELFVLAFDGHVYRFEAGKSTD